MDKLVSFIKKNYIYFNVIFLLLTIYIILFPIISIPISKIFPEFGICPYLKMTGKPCPLCGGTRYIAGLTRVFHDIRYLFQPFGIMMIVLLCENFFRFYNIITRKKEKSIKWVDRDISIHLFLLNIFNIYEIVYIIMQNKP